MNSPISKRIILCVLCLALVLGCAGLGAAAAELPARAELQSGVNVSSNAKASVDWSNLSEGFVSVSYTGGKNVRIKMAGWMPTSWVMDAHRIAQSEIL